MSKNEKVNLDRKEKYEALRNAGFTAREATIYKDYSWNFVELKIKGKTDELQAIADAFKTLKGIMNGNNNKK